MPEKIHILECGVVINDLEPVQNYIVLWCILMADDLESLQSGDGYGVS